MIRFKLFLIKLLLPDGYHLAKNPPKGAQKQRKLKPLPLLEDVK
jgi:hypothetical protein